MLELPISYVKPVKFQFHSGRESYHLCDLAVLEVLASNLKLSVYIV